MRNRAAAVTIIAALAASLPGSAGANCGVFRAQVYVPEGREGKILVANPKMVSYTTLKLAGPGLEERYQGQVVEAHLRFPERCSRECDVELVKIVRVVGAFDRLEPFHRDDAHRIERGKCRLGKDGVE